MAFLRNKGEKQNADSNEHLIFDEAEPQSSRNQSCAGLEQGNNLSREDGVGVMLAKLILELILGFS